MNTYIALLRGINVSGQKMIKMTALAELFQALKFTNVKTYIQSGNVVFQDKGKDPRALEKKIEKKIRDTFGFDVPVLVLNARTLPAILKNNPYLKKKGGDTSKLYLTFFNQQYDQKTVDTLSASDYGGDEFHVKDQVIYLHLPNNYGNTKLNNNFFESKLKITATTRNWKTMNELLRLAEQIAT
jgi:uncharacterized protein (DUF1697 family)